MKDSRTLINGDGESQNGVDPQTVEVTVCMPDRGNLKVEFCNNFNKKLNYKFYVLVQKNINVPHAIGPGLYLFIIVRYQ